MKEKGEEIRGEVAKIMLAALTLDDASGVDVYVALHGNTDCICIQVTDNKTLIYENRCFRTNLEKLTKIREEMVKMLAQAVSERRFNNEEK